MYARRLSLLAALWLSFAGSATGQPTAARRGPRRTDLYGDPLPAGAVARMGTVRWRLSLPTTYVLAFAPDGKTFYTVSRYGGILIWDSATGAIKCRVNEDDPLDLSNTVFVFSADASTLAIGRSAGTIVVVDPATGKERCRCLGHEGGIRNLVLSANGRVLVSYADDGTIRIWDARTGKQRRRQQVELLSQRELNSFRYTRHALSGDGKTLAWAVHQHRPGEKLSPVIYLADAETGRERKRLSDPGGFVCSLAFSPDGRVLASVATQRAVKLWDVQTGLPVSPFQEPAGINPLSAVFSPDGKKLAVTSVSPARTLVLDAHTGQAVCEIPQIAFGAGRLLFSPDSKLLVVVGSTTPAIFRFDAATGKERVDHYGHTFGVWAVQLSANGSKLASWDSGRALHLWDGKTGKHLSQLTASKEPVFSPSCRLFAFVQGKKLHVHNADTGRLLWTREAATSLPSAGSFSPDGRLLSTPETGGMVVLREAATGALVRECRGLSGALGTAFTTARDLLLGWGVRPDLSGPSGPQVEVAVWDVASGRLRRFLRGLPWSMVNEILLSPDGRWLVLVAKEERQVEVREIATGQKRLCIPQAGRVQSFTLSPDGGLLAISCDESGPADPGVSFRCYDAHSGRLLCEQRGHRGPVRALAFSGDGRYLATGSDDTTVLVWDMPSLLSARKALAAGPLDLKALWADLAGDDAARAYRAIQALIASPERTLPFLRAHLRPASAPVAPDRLAKLLADLDSSRFTVRAKAETELGHLGEAAEPALERALTGPVSLEKRRRLEQLLAKVSQLREQDPPPERLRQLRALEVLEQIGTPAARHLLEVLASGAADAWLTGEARAVLRRLEASGRR
jgi:WD40 repeat protein